MSAMKTHPLQNGTLRDGCERRRKNHHNTSSSQLFVHFSAQGHSVPFSWQEGLPKKGPRFFTTSISHPVKRDVFARHVGGHSLMAFEVGDFRFAYCNYGLLGLNTKSSDIGQFIVRWKHFFNRVPNVTFFLESIHPHVSSPHPANKRSQVESSSFASHRPSCYGCSSINHSLSIRYSKASPADACPCGVAFPFLT